MQVPPPPATLLSMSLPTQEQATSLLLRFREYLAEWDDASFGLIAKCEGENWVTVFSGCDLDRLRCARNLLEEVLDRAETGQQWPARTESFLYGLCLQLGGLIERLDEPQDDLDTPSDPP